MSTRSSRTTQTTQSTGREMSEIIKPNFGKSPILAVGDIVNLDFVQYCADVGLVAGSPLSGMFRHLELGDRIEGLVYSITSTFHKDTVWRGQDLGGQARIIDIVVPNGEMWAIIDAVPLNLIRRCVSRSIRDDEVETPTPTQIIPFDPKKRVTPREA